MWEKLRAWVHDSETIAWARIQMIGGAILAVLIATDLSPLLATGMPTKQQMIFAGIVFTQGVITEIARRVRSSDL